MSGPFIISCSAEHVVVLAASKIDPDKEGLDALSFSMIDPAGKGNAHWWASLRSASSWMQWFGSPGNSPEIIWSFIGFRHSRITK
jgi:hypothetical protein